METLASTEGTRLAGALTAWSKRLGSEHVLTAREELAAYEQNVSGFRRDLPAVIRPATTEDVQHVVSIANEFGISLYPLSCGRNWGLGSRLPAQDDCVICDLGRMNRIREVHAKHRYAIIEPGVTQGQLYDYLCEHDLPLMMNVTGAGRDTSVIGNALERGIGYFATRGDELSAMEIVLGSGERIRTGFAHYPVASTQHLYQPGIGPSLDGIMHQSNFGIVTRATVSLMPKPSASAAMVASIDDPLHLPALVEALRELYRDDIIRTIAHIGNSNRSRDTLEPLVYAFLSEHDTQDDARTAAHSIVETEIKAPWTAICGLHGEPALLKQAKRAIRRRLSGVAHVRFLNDERLDLAKRMAKRLRFLKRCNRRLAMLHAMEPLYGMTKGIPTDAALHSMAWPLSRELLKRGENPDAGSAGMMYCLPLMPATGDDAEHAINMIDRILAAHGFEPYVTLNLIDDRTLEAVINIIFDRKTPQQVETAHVCMAELHRSMIKRGYLPYRVSIEALKDMVDKNDGFWKTVTSIKQALDPNGIISPGRYCP